MSVTTGTVAHISSWESGVFSVTLNGNPTGPQIPGWNPPGTYCGSSDKVHRQLVAAKKNGDVVTIYGTEAPGSFASYEGISMVNE